MRRKTITDLSEKLIARLHDKDGLSFRSIADHIGNVSNEGVRKAYLRQKAPKLPKTDGRRRKTTKKEDRMIARESKKDETLTANEIKNALFLRDLSTRTVQRRLVEAGLPGRIPAKKPFISKENAKRRLAFAQKYIDWTIDDWKRVLFTDETKLNKIGSDGRRYVHRPANKRYDKKFTKGTVKFGGGNIMIWTCMSWFGPGPVYLVRGNWDSIQYRDDILENVMLPYANENLPNDWVFLQDNDSKHKSGIVTKWLNRHRIRQLSYTANGERVKGVPAPTSDFNAIENAFSEAKGRLNNRRFKKDPELLQAFEQAWQSIPLGTFRHLVESMLRRMNAIKKAHGYYTEY